LGNASHNGGDVNDVGVSCGTSSGGIPSGVATPTKASILGAQSASAASAVQPSGPGAELLAQIQQLLATTPNIDPYDFLVSVCCARVTALG
jgi:hypothetical protein